MSHSEKAEPRQAQGSAGVQGRGPTREKQSGAGGGGTWPSPGPEGPSPAPRAAEETPQDLRAQLKVEHDSVVLRPLVRASPAPNLRTETWQSLSDLNSPSPALGKRGHVSAPTAHRDTPPPHTHGRPSRQPTSPRRIPINQHLCLSRGDGAGGQETLQGSLETGRETVTLKPAASHLPPSNSAPARRLLPPRLAGRPPLVSGVHRLPTSAAV